MIEFEYSIKMNKSSNVNRDIYALLVASPQADQRGKTLKDPYMEYAKQRNSAEDQA